MSAYKNERGTWNVKFYYTDWTGKRKQKNKEGNGRMDKKCTKGR